LLLSAVHGVPADEPKGALVHRMIRTGIAHFVAHTNADAATGGVSDALAARFGLGRSSPLLPLDPIPAPLLDKLVVFVPTAAAAVLIDRLAAAGAGRLGDYDRCAWMTTGTGTFRAGPGAHPTIGAIGAVTEVAEARVEMIVPAAARVDVLRALRESHPYEEPAFDLFALTSWPGREGIGRVGDLEQELTLAAFTELAARVLPATAAGVRAAGDPAQLIRRVAVCGGSGASLIPLARAAGADVFLTADLKHHQVLDQVTEQARGPQPSMALIDAAHWATESPFLDDLAARLRTHFGTTVEVAVAAPVTDPWRLHVPSTESSENFS
jgi:putative NIF3 family GTP cyclohydrolase 1 type 2